MGGVGKWHPGKRLHSRANHRDDMPFPASLALAVIPGVMEARLLALIALIKVSRVPA